MAPDVGSTTSSTAVAGVLVVVPAYNERDCIAAVVNLPAHPVGNGRTI